MPNIASAKKRMKTSAKAGMANKSKKSNLSTIRRNLLESITAGEKKAANENFSSYCSALDKAVKTGLIKANNANRRKSRIAKKLLAL